ncbi:MAG: TetR/AcrR family transcriptional regulator [Limnobacter sp.]|nr:TetR/AcrR family transcriptional regulator [Limnobacter sp.]
MTTSSPSSKTQRPYAGKDAGLRQKERKDQLVQSSVRLFGKDGFSAVSIDAICADAGLTKRYFYEAFPDREALLTAAYERVTQEFLQSILVAAAPHLQDSRRLVRAGLTETFGFVQRNPDKGRLMMIEAMSVRGQLGKVYGKRYDEFVNLLLEFTRPLLTQAAPDERTFRVLAKGVVGALIHLCQGWIATDFKQPMQELIDGMELMMGGLGVQLGVKGWVDT